MAVNPEHDDELHALDTDGVPIVIIGTVLWAAALVVLLVLHTRLSHDGRGWWIWVAVAGLALGVIGVPYLRRFQRR